jgi:hypothetical protein
MSRSWIPISLAVVVCTRPGCGRLRPDELAYFKTQFGDGDRFSDYDTVVDRCKRDADRPTTRRASSEFLPQCSWVETGECVGGRRYIRASDGHCRVDLFYRRSGDSESITLQTDLIDPICLGRRSWPYDLRSWVSFRKTTQIREPAQAR